MVIPDDTMALVPRLAEALLQRGWMLATAESCTGGLIAAACTEVSGSSNWFERGFVSYSNEAKTGLLGVDAALITRDGAVSESVVRAMAQGAVAHSRARCAVAVTGVAGPTGGSVAKAPTCAMVAKASGTSPVIVDFEAMTAPGAGFTFESAGIMGGTYVYSDLLAPAADPSTSKLVLDAGHDEASTKALIGQIHNATWGGGMGLWFGCMDASVYTGVTFWVRGASPAGKVRLNLTVDKAVKVAEGGTCPDAGPCVRPFAELEVTDEWQQVTLAWADFTAGDSGGTALPAEVDAINGLDFGIPNDNMSRELELAIDDVAFTTE